MKQKIFIIALLVTASVALASLLFIDARWIDSDSGSSLDSAYASLELSDVDTSTYARIPDSSATKGGAYLLLYPLTEDTVTTTNKIQWGFLNPNTSTINWAVTLTTLASRDTTGIFNGSQVTHVTEPLCFRKPGGMNVVRAITTAGAVMGGWNAGGTAEEVLRIDALWTVPN